MGSMAFVPSLLGLGYIAGAWTGFLVLRQRQRAFEDQVSEVASNRQIEPQPGRAGLLEMDS